MVKQHSYEYIYQEILEVENYIDSYNFYIINNFYDFKRINESKTFNKIFNECEIILTLSNYNFDWFCNLFDKKKNILYVVDSVQKGFLLSKLLPFIFFKKND